MAAPRTSSRVLVVEDDPSTCTALQMLLELEGYCVETAENGAVALQHLRDNVLPSLILLDLSMPVMDGAAFRRAQLADPYLAQIPVVVCSAIHPEGVKMDHLKAAAYLTKPVDIDILLSTVLAIAA